MKGLDFARLRTVSVYIHIPFCDTRCRYCNFYFETAKSPSLIQKTLDAILLQAEDLWARLGSPRIDTLYFGGGTPSKIPSGVLPTFFEKLWGIFGNQKTRPLEVAFEANPEHIDEAYLDALAQSGVNRLSIGVQSFDDDHLSLLGRNANSVIVRTALTKVQQFQTRNDKPFSINLDLITGIPNQTSDGARNDALEAISFGADHLSLYALTIEPKTPLAQAVERRSVVPLSPVKHEELWEAAHEVLTSAGLNPYEVSNYARPGHESKHNLAYWSMKPYVGLGPGAVGTLALSEGSSRVPIRITQAAMFKFNTDPLDSASCELPNAREFFIDHLLTNLRIEAGINRAKIDACFGSAGLELLARLEDRWTSQGHEVVADTKKLAFGHRSRIILDPILADSLDTLDGESELISKLRLNWPEALDSKADSP